MELLSGRQNRLWLYWAPSRRECDQSVPAKESERSQNNNSEKIFTFLVHSFEHCQRPVTSGLGGVTQKPLTSLTHCLWRRSGKSGSWSFLESQMFSSPLTLEYTDLYQLINHVKLETQCADHSLGMCTLGHTEKCEHVTLSCLLVSSSSLRGWNKHVMETLLWISNTVALFQSTHRAWTRTQTRA